MWTFIAFGRSLAGNIADITMAMIPLDDVARPKRFPTDKAYRRRSVIERLFCKPKNWRRIATRYDRYAQNYLSGLVLAALIIEWT
jgi:transposase